MTMNDILSLSKYSHLSFGSLENLYMAEFTRDAKAKFSDFGAGLSTDCTALASSSTSPSPSRLNGWVEVP